MEMGKYLRQTVDNSLEEGQFESAITILTQLCSPNHIPSIIHVLHLVFIALHASSSPCRLDDADPALDRAALLLQSPRKIIKHTKSAIVLEPPAVLAAQSLLHALLRTNGPAALARALPAYPEAGTKNQAPELEFVDSPIYHQAAALKNARCAWDILKGGYATKAMQLPKGRGKQPRSSGIGREPSFNVIPDEDEIKIVGDDSWFLLDWLVSLFENDAEATQKSCSPKHSPLLLKQLPPPPIGSSTRWDASEPLKVVFYAFKQKDSRRQRTGLRLLKLLIDLTQTSFLNLPSFSATVLSQLAFSCSSSSPSSSNPSPSSTTPVTPPRNPSSSSAPSLITPWTPQDALTALFTRLPSTPASLSFKIALCKKILAELDGGAADASAADFSGKPVSRAGLSPNNANPHGNGASSSFAGASPSGGQAQTQSTVPRPRPVPRVQPRPLHRNDTLAAVSDAGASASAAGPASSASVITMSPSVSMSSVVSSSPVVAAAPTPTPPPLPQLPPLADIARLLHLRAPPVPSPSTSSSSSPNHPPPSTHLDPSHAQTQGQTRPRRSRTSRSASATRALTPTPTHTQSQSQSQSQSPWTSPPALLLRVKFELLLAWVGVRRARRAAAAKEKEKEEQTEMEMEMEKNDVSDAELGALIEAVFGVSDVNGNGEEEGGEMKERRFYRDALRAFGGLPITSM